MSYFENESMTPLVAASVMVPMVFCAASLFRMSPSRPRQGTTEKSLGVEQSEPQLTRRVLRLGESVGNRLRLRLSKGASVRIDRGILIDLLQQGIELLRQRLASGQGGDAFLPGI
jgi:hypothetical protein